MKIFVQYNDATFSEIGELRELTDCGYRRKIAWGKNMKKLVGFGLGMVNFDNTKDRFYFHKNGNTEVVEITEDEYQRILKINSEMKEEKVKILKKERAKSTTFYQSHSANSDVYVDENGNEYIMD